MDNFSPVLNDIKNIGYTTNVENRILTSNNTSKFVHNNKTYKYAITEFRLDHIMIYIIH